MYVNYDNYSLYHILRNPGKWETSRSPLQVVLDGSPSFPLQNDDYVKFPLRICGYIPLFWTFISPIQSFAKWSEPGFLGVIDKDRESF